MEESFLSLLAAIKFLASRLGPHAVAEVERMLAPIEAEVNQAADRRAVQRMTADAGSQGAEASATVQPVADTPTPAV